MVSEDFRDQLNKIPLIESLPAELRSVTCDILLEVSTESALEEGDVLYTEGDEDANTGAVLVEGRLAVGGEDETAIEVTAPELLGEMQQFNEFGQRTATVVAKSKAQLLEFSWEEFVERILNEDSITQDMRGALKDALAKYAGDRLEELKG